MKRIYGIILFVCVSITLVALISFCSSSDEEPRGVPRLWPEIEPYETGTLKVSKIHEIYYELCGNPYAFAIMENYYMANRCFLEEGQLLKNADKIAHIPTFMVNGRYDMICPPKNAYRLHKLLPKSELVIADAAGHWMGERPIERALLKFMKSFE